MITIDEAIAFCENQISFSNEEYRKIAEWLEELKIYKSDGFAKDLQKLAYRQGYSKAIDDAKDIILQSLGGEHMI